MLQARLTQDGFVCCCGQHTPANSVDWSFAVTGPVRDVGYKRIALQLKCARCTLSHDIIKDMSGEESKFEVKVHAGGRCSCS